MSTPSVSPTDEDCSQSQTKDSKQEINHTQIISEGMSKRKHNIDLCRAADILSPQIRAISETMRHSEMICTNVISGDVFSDNERFCVGKEISPVVRRVEMMAISHTIKKDNEIHSENDIVERDKTIHKSTSNDNVDLCLIDPSLPTDINQLLINIERAQIPWSPIEDDVGRSQMLIHKTAFCNSESNSEGSPYGVQNVLMSEATILIHMQRAIFAKRKEAYDIIKRAFDLLLGTGVDKFHTETSDTKIENTIIENVRKMLVDANVTLTQYAILPFAQLFALNTGQMPVRYLDFQFAKPHEGGHPVYQNINDNHLKNIGRPIVGLVMQEVSNDLRKWMSQTVMNRANNDPYYDATLVLAETGHNVMDACRVIHSMHVVHGDIKTSNIGIGSCVITYAGSTSKNHTWIGSGLKSKDTFLNGVSTSCIKFIDFGTAIVHNMSICEFNGSKKNLETLNTYPCGENLVSPTVLRAMRCTDNWLAPEMLLSESKLPLDPFAMDIYAIGLVCMSLITRTTHIRTLYDPREESPLHIATRAILTGGIGDCVVIPAMSSNECDERISLCETTDDVGNDDDTSLTYSTSTEEDDCYDQNTDFYKKMLEYGVLETCPLCRCEMGENNYTSEDSSIDFDSENDVYTIGMETDTDTDTDISDVSVFHIDFDYRRPEATLLDSANIWRNQRCPPCPMIDRGPRNNNMFCLPCYASLGTKILVNPCNLENTLPSTDAYDSRRIHPIFDIINFANGAHLIGIDITKAILVPDNLISSNEQRDDFYTYVTSPALAKRLRRSDQLYISYIAIAIRSIALAQMAPYIAICTADTKLLDSAKRMFVEHTVQQYGSSSNFLLEHLDKIVDTRLEITEEQDRKDNVFRFGTFVVNWRIDTTEVLDVFSTLGWIGYLSSISKCVRELRQRLLPDLASISADMVMRSRFNDKNRDTSTNSDQDEQSSNIRKKIHEHSSIAIEELVCYESLLQRISNCLYLNPKDRKWTLRSDYRHEENRDVKNKKDNEFEYNDNEDLSTARRQMVERQTRIIRKAIDKINLVDRDTPGVFTKRMCGPIYKTDLKTVYHHAYEHFGIDRCENNRTIEENTNSAEELHISNIIQSIITATDTSGIFSYDIESQSRPVSSFCDVDDVLCKQVENSGMDVKNYIFDAFMKKLSNNNNVKPDTIEKQKRFTNQIVTTLKKQLSIDVWSSSGGELFKKDDQNDDGSILRRMGHNGCWNVAISNWLMSRKMLLSRFESVNTVEPFALIIVDIMIIMNFFDMACQSVGITNRVLRLRSPVFLSIICHYNILYEKCYNKNICPSEEKWNNTVKQVENVMFKSWSQYGFESDIEDYHHSETESTTVDKIDRSIVIRQWIIDQLGSNTYHHMFTHYFTSITPSSIVISYNTDLIDMVVSIVGHKKVQKKLIDYTIKSLPISKRGGGSVQSNKEFYEHMVSTHEEISPSVSFYTHRSALDALLWAEMFSLVSEKPDREYGSIWQFIRYVLGEEAYTSRTIRLIAQYLLDVVKSVGSDDDISQEKEHLTSFLA